MDATNDLATMLAHTADRAGPRHLATLGSLVLVAVVLCAVAFAVGVLVADLLAQESEAILAAPFRWI